MIEWNTHELIAADKKFVWHPFTNMAEWCAPEREPLCITPAQLPLATGAIRDSILEVCG
jgi:hypothetical protein